MNAVQSPHYVSTILPNCFDPIEHRYLAVPCGRQRPLRRAAGLVEAVLPQQGVDQKDQLPHHGDEGRLVGPAPDFVKLGRR